MTEQEMVDKITRERLDASKEARQFAAAIFPLKVANMASTLHRLLRLMETYTGEVPTETQENIDYLEKQIRDCYRDTFGTELGGKELR